MEMSGHSSQVARVHMNGGGRVKLTRGSRDEIGLVGTKSNHQQNIVSAEQTQVPTLYEKY